MTTDAPSGNGWKPMAYDTITAIEESKLSMSASYDRYQAELKAKEDKRIDEALERARAVRGQKAFDEVMVAQGFAGPAGDRLRERLEQCPTEGRKDDANKPPLHLIPPEYLYAVAEILDYGQRKYSARNWENGMAWSRCYRAALGHLLDWFARKGPDPETGKSHLWHAAASVMFLVCYEIRGSGNDDRPLP